MDEKYLSNEEITKYLQKIDNNQNNNAIEGDLHNHTTGSDGTQTPLRFLLRSHNRGKNIVSISDHDSVKGYEILEDQIKDIIENLQETLKRNDITKEEKEKATKGAERLLNVLSDVKVLPAIECITSYDGHVIEILGYGVNPEMMKEELPKLKEGLVPGVKVLLEGTDRIIKDNNLPFDRFVIENRNDFKKLFFHELTKHAENIDLYENIEGETEEEKTENFSKKYLENPKSKLYVDMEKTEKRDTKAIKADFLKMLKINEKNFVFDENVIAYSHAVTGEFYNELRKHPECVELLSEDTKNDFKKFIYQELYNPKSPFFIDMTPSRPSREDTIKAIHNAGGKAFLAHPGRYFKAFGETTKGEKESGVKSAIEEGNLIDGLDGIEVFYPDHVESFREYLLNTCKQNELLASGGSDDHLAPKDGPQYKMGSISIEDIPETKWIKDHLQSGTDFIEKQKSELLEVLHSKKEKSLEQNSKTIQMEEGRDNDE